jgi:hypothetical protein
MAVGPDHQIGLTCGGTNALVIDDRTGNAVSGGFLTGLGGADEMWFNPGDNHYFFGRTGAVSLGVADAGPPPSADSGAQTGPGSHSVAAVAHELGLRADPRQQRHGAAFYRCGLLARSTARRKMFRATAEATPSGCIAICTASRYGDDHRAGRR